MEDRTDYVKIDPPHPGESLMEDFLQPLGMTSRTLAVALCVPVSRIDAIVKGKRAISGDTALRLARYFGVSARFWLNLQVYYDLEIAKDKSASTIEREVQPRNVVR